MCQLDEATVRRALTAAQQSTNGHVDSESSHVLQLALASIWGKIQAAPDSYVMTQLEFGVFNYFREQFQDDATARRAVQRYWNSTRNVNGR